MGADAACTLLEAEWRRGHYDGLLGFSQGAVAATLLIARLERSARSGLSPVLPRFAILCAGFRTPLPANESLKWFAQAPAAMLATPALVMVGQHDTVTPEAQAHKVARLFSDVEVHVMAGCGHAMPQRPADIERLVAFVRQKCHGTESAL